MLAMYCDHFYLYYDLFIWSFFFVRSHITKDDFELLILLYPPIQYWNYVCTTMPGFVYLTLSYFILIHFLNVGLISQPDYNKNNLKLLWFAYSGTQKGEGER